MSNEDEIPLELAAASAAAAAAAAAAEAEAAESEQTVVKGEAVAPPDPPAALASTPAATSTSYASPHPTTVVAEPSSSGLVNSGQENTGRWTKVEHAAFLKGIEKYGKEWKKVAILVKTRTVMQTRTHAQKYFEKLAHIVAKQNGTPATKISTSISSTKKLDKKKPVATTVAAGGALKSPPRAGATPFSSPTTPAPIVSFTDTDILVPISDSTALRSANKEYMDMMKANCFIFHSLPLAEQAWFVRNLVNFITVVRGRRWVACNFYHPNSAPQYQLLPDPTTVVQNDFRMDPLKVAGFAFHPFWLLGEHDPGNAHNGMPFLHRTIDGSWKAVTTAQVRDILKGEGPKNLLLMPPTVHLEAATSTGISGSTAAASTATATGDAEPKEEDIKVEDGADEEAADDEAADEEAAAAETETNMDDVPELPPAVLDDVAPGEVVNDMALSPDEVATATAAALAVTLDTDAAAAAATAADPASEGIDAVAAAASAVEEDEVAAEESPKKESRRGGASGKRSVAQKALPVTRKAKVEEDEEEDDGDDEEEEEKGKVATSGRATRGSKKGSKDDDEEKVEAVKKSSRLSGAKAKDEPSKDEGQRRSKRQRN